MLLNHVAERRFFSPR